MKFTPRVVRSAFSLGASSIITQFLMMVYIIIVAKWLDADNYSYIAAIYAVVSLTSFVFNWGLNEWMMKYNSVCDSPRHLGGSVILFKVIFGVLWGISLFFFLQYLNPGLYLSDILIISMLDVWIDSMFFSLLVILVLKSRTYFASILLVTSRIIRLLCGLFLIYFGIKSIFLFSITRLICTLIIFSATWFWAKPIIISKGTMTPWKVFRDSSAYNYGEVFNSIYLHTDVNLISFMGAERIIIANYSVVIGLINAVMVFPFSIYSVLMSSLSRTYHENMSKFLHHIWGIYAGFAAIGGLVWSGVVFIGIPIIRLFLGESYYVSGEILFALSPILIIKSLNQANITYLVSVDWQAKRLIPQTSVVFLKALIGVLVFLKYQVMGVVYVSVVAEFVLLGCYTYQVCRHYGANRELIRQ